MSQTELNAFIAVAHQLPEIAKQLKIANELKAWELKHKYRASLLAHVDDSDDDSDEIDKILKGE